MGLEDGNISTFNLKFFNNTDCECSAKLISDYFKIDYDNVFDELCLHYQSDYNVSNFIEKFNIDIKQRKTYITCRHAMTAFDNLMYLRKKGLLNLKQMLERKTPLSEFLLNNNIKIDIKNKLIHYRDSYYSILHRDEQCTNCIFEKYQCKSFFNNNLPDYKNCDYREELSILEGKLYYDKCETEVFIDGTIKDIYSYNSVRYSPEILNTIENITYFYDNKIGDLQSKWRYIPNNRYYILEFDVDINNFELISTNAIYDGYGEIGDILERFGYDEYDFYSDNVSPIVYQNIFILTRLVDNFLWGNGEKFGQILSTTKINGESIRIIREHAVNDSAKEEL